MLLPLIGVLLIGVGVARHFGGATPGGDAKVAVGKGDKAKRPSRADELAEARRDAKAQVLAERKIADDADAKAKADKRAAVDAAKIELRKEMGE